MTGGAMGSAPAWYTTIRAARYLGVPPWELEQVSLKWKLRALAAQASEQAAEAQADRVV